MSKTNPTVLTEVYINQLYNSLLETNPAFKQFVEDNKDKSIEEILSKNYKKVSNIY